MKKTKTTFMAAFAVLGLVAAGAVLAGTVAPSQHEAYVTSHQTSLVNLAMNQDVNSRDYHTSNG